MIICKFDIIRICIQAKSMGHSQRRMQSQPYVDSNSLFFKSLE